MSNKKTLTRTGMTANSVLACRGLNKGEEREREEEREKEVYKQELGAELKMIQMKGGLNSRGCAGLPL